MNINLVVVGKIKEEYLNDAIKEYLKRISVMANLSLIEIKEFTTDDVNKNLLEEGKLILKVIKENDYVVTLEIEGKQLDSVSFSNMISNHYTYSNKQMTFVIGSSNGLHESVKKRSDNRLSFSKMTFPHQLMRVICLEQLYRALSIINNLKYHK